MGQKVHPNGFRVGITEGWNSRWFAPKKLFGELLVEDQQIRAFVDNKLNKQPPNGAIAKVEIERTREELKVLLHTARPGVVIGPKGAEVDKLRNELEDLTGRKVKVEIAVGRGKQTHDKRESLKKADAKREMQRALSRRR